MRKIKLFFALSPFIFPYFRLKGEIETAFVLYHSNHRLYDNYFVFKLTDVKRHTYQFQAI
ncbi:hypothetical protein HMPREF1632_00280 [Mageeibacillus indolicus 0009-5]|nr:hypothetical protein HMPREF1632_00280 [Mageeibacillus indolicus 0009-5]